jgi:hypothetical protein
MVGFFFVKMILKFMNIKMTNTLDFCIVLFISKLKYFIALDPRMRKVIKKKVHIMILAPPCNDRYIEFSDHRYLFAYLDG